MATPLDEFDRDVLSAQIRDTEEDVADAQDLAQRDRLTRRLDQLTVLQAALAT
jgi:hypothetical protein